MVRGRRPARLDVVAPAGGRYDNLRRTYKRNADEMTLSLHRARRVKAKTCMGLPLEAVEPKIARTYELSRMTDDQLDAALDESRVAMAQRLAELSKGGR